MNKTIKINLWIYVLLIVLVWLWIGVDTFEYFFDKPDLNQQIELVHGCLKAGFDKYRLVNDWVVCVPNN